MMDNETLSNTTALLTRLAEAFEKALNEAIYDLPRLLLAASILALALLAAKLGGSMIRRLVAFSGVSRLLQRYVPGLPLSLEALAEFFFDLGVVILAIGTAVALLFPQYMASYSQWAQYLLRVISIALLIIVTFAVIDGLVMRMRIETKVRAFASMIAYMLSLIFILDLAGVSEGVKAAVAQGISIGLGLAIGVFSLWYFLHDYLEEYIRLLREQRRGE